MSVQCIFQLPRMPGMFRLLAHRGYSRSTKQKTFTVIGWSLYSQSSLPYEEYSQQTILLHTYGLSHLLIARNMEIDFVWTIAMTFFVIWCCGEHCPTSRHSITTLCFIVNRGFAMMAFITTMIWHSGIAYSLLLNTVLNNDGQSFCVPKYLKT